MLDLANLDSSSSDNTGSGAGDILDSILGAAQTGYTDYALSSAGIIPTNNPGQYAIQSGSRAQIIQPAQQNSMMTIVIVVVLFFLGFFAFKSID